MLKIYIYWHKCWCYRCGTGRDGTTSEDRATQLLICEPLSFAINGNAEAILRISWSITTNGSRWSLNITALKSIQEMIVCYQIMFEKSLTVWLPLLLERPVTLKKGKSTWKSYNPHRRTMLFFTVEPKVSCSTANNF